MKIIEGTVDEIVEYQLRTGMLPTTASLSGDPVPAGDAVPEAGVTADATHLESTNEGFHIRRHVYTRATSSEHADAVFAYLDALVINDLRVDVVIGKSVKTEDGKTDYLMIRNQGKQHFGAVVYVEPANGRMTYRLRTEDIADFDDERIVERQVKSSQAYAIRSYLLADGVTVAENVALAIRLTQRALEGVQRG